MHLLRCFLLVLALWQRILIQAEEEEEQQQACSSLDENSECLNPDNVPNENNNDEVVKNNYSESNVNSQQLGGVDSSSDEKEQDENIHTGETGEEEEEDSEDDYDDEDDWDDEEDDEEDEELELYLNEWGKPQIVYDGPEGAATIEVIERSKEYMTKEVFVDEKYEFVREYCKNKKALCSYWAGEGACEENPEYMIEKCAPACLRCGFVAEELREEGEVDDDAEEDEEDDEEAEELLEEGEEDDGAEEDEDDEYEDEDDEIEEPKGKELGDLIPTPWGKPQNIGRMFPHKVRALMRETYTYMTTIVYVDELYEPVYEECENRHRDCSYWATFGECEKNQDYMTMQCAPACQSCDQLDFELRCPVNEDAPTAWGPGDLNKMFERITTDPYWEQFGPISIISSPATTGGPWVVTMDNFVSDAECERFIAIGHEEGYERSTDVGEELFDGTYDSVESTSRTSSNAWCPDLCAEDPITGPVHERISELSGLHYNHSEWLQLLHYDPGQFYGDHHDFIQYESEDRPSGPRVLTVFLYLNDVEAGGGTHFSRMGITVEPKKGRALIWPSVLDDEPFDMDDRTHHEALKVEAGIKYGANAWLHQRDFKTAFYDGCI